MHKLLIFVGLQAVFLQNAYSQAINHLQPTVTEIIESVDSLIIQPNNIVEPTVANQPPQPICPQCGRPAHLCDCGCLAVTVSDSYSNVANQLKDNSQMCPHCGLSAELCTCGSLPEVAETIFTVNQPKNQSVCPRCGLSAELCKCGFFPLVGATKTSEVNQANSEFCPNCGHPVELCKCGLFPEVAVTETAVGQPDLPQSMCPFCGLPVEHCTCQA